MLIDTPQRGEMLEAILKMVNLIELIAAKFSEN